MKAILAPRLALAGCLAVPAMAADAPDFPRSGKLEIALTFEAAGQRVNPGTGAYSRMTFSRSLKYVAVLRGAYSATGSLDLTPREQRDRNGRSCGRGTT